MKDLNNVLKSIKTIIKSNSTELSNECCLSLSSNIVYDEGFELDLKELKDLLRGNKFSVKRYSICHDDDDYIEKLKINLSNSVSFDFVGIDTLSFYPVEVINHKGKRIFEISIGGGYNSYGTFYPDKDLSYDMGTFLGNFPCTSILSHISGGKRKICKLTIR